MPAHFNRSYLTVNGIVLRHNQLLVQAFKGGFHRIQGKDRVRISCSRRSFLLTIEGDLLLAGFQVNLSLGRYLKCDRSIHGPIGADPDPQ